MQHDQKMAFVAQMADKALTHSRSTPNVPLPTGGMSHDKMLAFLQQMTKNGLQHFDSGGTALATPVTSNPGNNNTTSGGLGGGLSNILGANNQFQASAAPIQAGTNAAQLNNAYTGAQGALNTQQGITNTLNTGLNQGANTQANLTNQLTAEANGQGPNPALASLNQQTGQNIAQQAALAAGQRGAGANAGLIAAQNAQQGAATQQNAVGQAATLQAQQQLAAQGNLQNLAASQVSQGTGATQGLNNAQQNEQNILQGANTSLNNANVSQQSNINNVNAGVSTSNANTSGNVVGGLLGGAASILGLAKGGEVPWTKKPQMMASGGVSGQQVTAPSQSYVGNWLNSNVDNQGPAQLAAPSFSTSGANFDLGIKPKKSAPATTTAPMADPIVNAQADPMSSINLPGQGFGVGDLSAGGADAGGGFGALISEAAPAAALGLARGGSLMKNGGGIPGKAKVNHDSLKNDTVPAMLSPGEVVIDKDTLNDPGPAGQMARAVAHHIAKKNKGGRA